MTRFSRLRFQGNRRLRISISWLTFTWIALTVLTGCRDEPGQRASRATETSVLAAETDSHGHEHEAEHAEEVRLAADAIERYGVTIERATLQKLRPTFPAPARVAFNAEAMAHVGSSLAGRVVDLSAKLGDIVAKGDALLIVESPALGEAQSEFLQKRILAESAVAGVELARSALDRASRLFEQNRGIALDDVQKREMEFKSAQAAHQTARAAAAAAENKLHLLGMSQESIHVLAASNEVSPRFTIRAPLPGRVVEREVTLGELVSPEKEALIVIADTTTLWVLADIPEARLPETVIGATARLRSASVDAHRHEGVVSYISPMVDPRTRSAPVRIVVHCEHGTLWPGMFVQVEIVAVNPAEPDPPAVVAIPAEAIQTVEGVAGVFVPVPDEENTFALRAISHG